MLARRLLKKLAYSNYFTAKIYFKIFSSLSTRGKEPLWIYQMGKVGSSSIRRSLGAINHNYATYVVHDLTQEVIDEMENAYRKKWSSSYNPTHLWQSQYLRKRLNNGSWAGRWKIISLARDPVARNISSFFNTLYMNYGVSGKSIVDLERLFLEEFDHETPLVWYDRELKGVCDIDIFSSDFPKQKGYKIYQGNKANALVVRLESLNMCAKDAFKDFLDIDGFTLVNANIGQTKNYAALYREFLASVSFPDSYIKKMYDSKYARYFYSEEEIEGFKSKWCK